MGSALRHRGNPRGWTLYTYESLIFDLRSAISHRWRPIAQTKQPTLKPCPTSDSDIASEGKETHRRRVFWLRGRFKRSEEGYLKSEGGLCVLERVLNASEGVRLLWKGFCALEKVKTRSIEGFYTLEEGFYTLEGVQMHRKMVKETN